MRSSIAILEEKTVRGDMQDAGSFELQDGGLRGLPTGEDFGLREERLNGASFLGSGGERSEIDGGEIFADGDAAAGGRARRTVQRRNGTGLGQGNSLGSLRRRASRVGDKDGSGV